MIGTAAAIIGGSLIGAAGSAYSSRQGAKAASKGADQAVAEQQRQFDLVRSDTAPGRELGRNATALLSRLYGYGPSATAAVGPNGSTGSQIGSGGYGVTPGGGIRQGVQLGADNGGSAGWADIVRQTMAGREQPITRQAPGSAPAGGPDMSAFFESPDYQFNLAEGQKGIDRSLAARGGALSGAGVREGVRYASGMASREYGAFVDRLMQQAGLGNTGIGASAAAGANAANNIGAAYQNAGNTRASIYMNNGANINNAVQGGLQNYMLSRYLGTGSPGMAGGTYSPDGTYFPG